MLTTAPFSYHDRSELAGERELGGRVTWLVYPPYPFPSFPAYPFRPDLARWGKVTWLGCPPHLGIPSYLGGRGGVIWFGDSPSPLFQRPDLAGNGRGSKGHFIRVPQPQTGPGQYIPPPVQKIPPMERITDTNKNITFPHTTCMVDKYE